MEVVECSGVESVAVGGVDVGVGGVGEVAVEWKSDEIRLALCATDVCLLISVRRGG